MDFNNFRISQICIKQFKNLSSLTLDFTAGFNVIFASERGGKTSVCEFIEYMLYGFPALELSKIDAQNISGEITVSTGQKKYFVKRIVSNSENEFSFYDSDNKSVKTDLTPGEYLTGLTLNEFKNLSYFGETRFGLPEAILSEDILKNAALKKNSTRFLNYYSIKEKVEKYKNAEKSGSIDKLESEKEELITKLNSENELTEQIQNIETEISELLVKFDENEKRAVIIKADMSQYSDDEKLDENIKSTQSLKNEIREKEKRLKIFEYNLANKTGKLSLGELESLKNDYNLLSAELTNQAEIRNSLQEAKENLNYHRHIFDGKEELTYYEKLKERINNFKLTKNFSIIFSILFIALSPAVYFVLKYFKYSDILCICAAASLFLASVASFMISRVCKTYSYELYSRANIKDFDELTDICEKLTAHHKTDKVYSNKICEITQKYNEVSSEVERIRKSIFQSLSKIGRNAKDDDILEICDEVIEENCDYYDLSDDIELLKIKCEKILTKDIDNDNATISNEYLSLQKELDFIQKQNEMILKKKNNFELKKTQIQSNLPDKDLINQRITVIDNEITPLLERYNELLIEHSLLKRYRDEFVNQIKDAVLQRINSLIPESLISNSNCYVFNENLELCYTENGAVIHLSRCKNTVAEFGIIAFRISSAQISGHKKIPLILDNIFKNSKIETFDEFVSKLTDSSSQILYTTSTKEIINNSKVISNCQNI